MLWSLLCITDLHFSTLVRKEKAQYEAKAAKRKTDYEKQMKAYNKKQVDIPDLSNHMKSFRISLSFIFIFVDFFLFWQESTEDDGDEESNRSKSEVSDDEEVELFFILFLLSMT